MKTKIIIQDDENLKMNRHELTRLENEFNEKIERLSK
jgi:hypothetical protein